MSTEHFCEPATEAGAEGTVCCERRSVLRGALALGAVGLGGVIAGCGGGSYGASAPQRSTAANPPPPTDTSSQSSTTSASAAASSAGAGSLGLASQIPVGGGMVFDKDKVVVTQPTAGEYKAFSAVCTHQQCTVSEVADGTINCPCHGSKYKITDGSVVRGPAPRPLDAKQVTVSDGNIHVT